MATLADAIEAYLKRLIRSQSGYIEVRRCDLADSFSCAPSQINYVLETRFRAEHGYSVESRRGGGGYIRIRRIVIQPHPSLFGAVCECIGDQISWAETAMLLNRLYESGNLSKDSARDISRFISVETNGLPLPWQDVLRASVLKAMLFILLSMESDEDGRDDQ